MHELDEAVAVPLEEAVLVAGDLERVGPLLVVADVVVEADQQVEETPEEVEPVGADRVRLQPPGGDPVGDPSRCVVPAAEVLREVEQPFGRVLVGVGIVTHHGEPVDGPPEGREPPDQLVADARVGLPPGGRHVAQQREKVPGLRQVEPGERAER